MKYSNLLLLGVLALLAACDSSHRPVYSGHEESTEGVPGFVKGKKVSPHVKLGQSYSVDGETYVPRNQPDYVEEGMASWYGPGFHGGKTANGEKFDSNELTAAHRTLPLPSIVRVTMISTGKQAYVRVNDRGPFAHSRIIDLSRGAAEKVGLLRAGVAKVRVEYMPKESARFAELLEQGRSPKSIDIASEVLNSDSDSAPARSHAARNDDAQVEQVEVENSMETADAAPVGDVAAADLPVASPTAKPMTKKGGGGSPFTIMDANAAEPSMPEPMADAITETTPASGKPTLSPVAATRSGTYVQLGAFQNEANAERLRKQYADTANMLVVKKPNAQGVTLYHVRSGPYGSTQEGQQALDKLRSAGAEAKLIHE